MPAYLSFPHCYDCYIHTILVSVYCGEIGGIIGQSAGGYKADLVRTRTRFARTRTRIYFFDITKVLVLKNNLYSEFF